MTVIIRSVGCLWIGSVVFSGGLVIFILLGVGVGWKGDCCWSGLLFSLVGLASNKALRLKLVSDMVKISLDIFLVQKIISFFDFSLSCVTVFCFFDIRF